MNALVRASGPQSERRLCGRAGLQLAVLTALTLGACSTAPQSEDASRRPSLRVADAALASGAPGMALRVADLTLAADPHNVRALTARGDALYALDQRDQAETAYRAAIAIEPTAAGAQIGLGRIVVRTDPRAGEAAFVTALKSDPGNITALNNLGIARDLQGRYGDAEEAYYDALTRSPGSTEVQVNLGLSLALSGHSDEAVRLLRGVASDPAAAQAWRKELVDALTLAGDGQWAQQMLPADGAPVLADNPAPAEPLIADATPDEHGPHAAPPIPVLKADLAPVEDTAMPVVPAIITPVTKQRWTPPKLQVAVIRPTAPAEGPFVQLGSLNSEADADFEWRRLSRRVADELSGRQPTITRADVHGRIYWRLRTFGFASLDEAQGLCGRLQAAAQRCWSGR